MLRTRRGGAFPPPPTFLATGCLLLLLILEDASAATESMMLDTGGLSRQSFPKGFVFGAATSAYQVEGMADGDGRGPSIWDEFIHSKPYGTGKVNEKGVAYYNRLIDYLLEKGITPLVNVYHNDYPLALDKRYKGPLARQFVKDYSEYADFCFATFGDRVKNWTTINEPRPIASLGYDVGSFAPGRCSKAIFNCSAGDSATEPYIVSHNLLLAHAAAVHIYRNKFLHPLVYGEYPRTMREIAGERLPEFTAEEAATVKGSFDFIGINQYTAYYVSNETKETPKEMTSYQADWKAKFSFAKNGVPIGQTIPSSVWVIDVPWGLYKCLMYVKEKYGNPTVILSENGMEEPANVTLPKALHDTTRIRYYKGYLRQLKKAVDDGANVVGYYIWSLLDNFEWATGYDSRFGIVFVDRRDSRLKRYLKMSAYWFKKLLQR
ncbi:unnamed protein product [Linum tenue]|uniref:Uncharacterized protein n=1 Tax=Linum tenue TaxID=586396 RepID=A0AAV0GRW0_9ROSI|nr:unnamed protein product [Linum tenue]